MNNYIKSGVGVVVLALILWAGVTYPKVVQTLGGSPSGTTFGDAKFAAVSINLANPGANGTSTSLINTDGTDRYVSAVKVGCEGIGTSQTAYTGTGLAALTMKVGTTSTSNPASFLSFAAISNTGITISTSTVDTMISSSTLLVATSSLAAVWPSNTPMTFYFNATNTAQCAIGVDYFQS